MTPTEELKQYIPKIIEEQGFAVLALDNGREDGCRVFQSAGLTQKNLPELVLVNNGDEAINIEIFTAVINELINDAAFVAQLEAVETMFFAIESLAMSVTLNKVSLVDMANEKVELLFAIEPGEVPVLYSIIRPDDTGRFPHQPAYNARLTQPLFKAPN